MLNFESFFKNHFNTKDVSDDNIKKFSQDHIARIVANNGGGTFTTILTDTTTAYTTYFGSITDEDLAFAIQQSLTKAADNLIASFKKAIQDDEGTIRGKYGLDSPTYQEFFPLGKKEYSGATKANIETLMTRMKDRTAAHAADFDPAFVAKYANFSTNYTTARNLQLQQIGEVTAGKSTTGATRDVIEVQLMKNLFFVGFNFPGNVDRCMDFFDQSIIRRKQSADSDQIGRVTGIIKDSVSGLPVEGVNVHAVDHNINDVQSDINGAYLTNNMPIGLTTLRFTKAGYKDFEIDVDVKDAGNTTFDVVMVKI